MYLTDEQFQTFQEKGFVVLSQLFSSSEIEAMQDEIPGLFSRDTPRRVLEKGSDVVRSVYGSHTESDIFARLARHPALVEPARRILGSDVYVYQFKINAKRAFDGDVWEWHQDFVFWQQEDGMPEPRVVNAVVFLDEVNEFNGPLLFIPGSHQEGVVSVNAKELDPAYGNGPAWISNLTAKLKYFVPREDVARFVVRSGGIEAPKGPSGSVLFFDSNIVHGSAQNVSPFDRRVVVVTYNSVENLPRPIENPRPDFLASRDFTPVVPLPGSSLLEAV
ncbi:MAG TPA: phytanoyl-CoA dioxygenase family protein [Thermoanaerobaculia bacterium]|nr:phytanoyl-CoA dioxygenase family protein [Thermoanaerobaculia bacterium]